MVALGGGEMESGGSALSVREKVRLRAVMYGMCIVRSGVLHCVARSELV